jgi:hypothetical protein
MALDDDAEPTTPDAPATAGRSRRRSARPWTNPAPAGRPAVDRARDDSWTSPGAPSIASPRPPTSPPLGSPAVVDLAPVTEQLSALQEQLTALQASVATPVPDSSLVTGPELAAAIENLGATLGGGMATLLTEHRNLLARDVGAAADRILEEVTTRLRAATTQTVDQVEERLRHLVSRATTELGEQLDLRLDKLQADVTGLRAVMLEIPDQTAVTDRLDQLAETVANSKGRDSGRVSPALAAAIERSVGAPIEALDETVHSVVDLVRELLDERLPEEALHILTREITALKRRIALRPAVGAPEEEVDAPEPTAPEPEAAPIDIPVVAEEPPKRVRAAKPAAAEPAPKVTGRRGRRTIKD